MDALKIQTEVLKELNKKIAGKRNAFDHRFAYVNYTIGDETGVAIITDGIKGELVPKDLYFLDNNKVFDREPINPGGLFDDTNYTRNVFLTNEVIQIDKKKQCLVFDFGDGSKKIWIDKALLTNFDLANCEFKAYNDRTPLHIYEYGRLRGIACPIHHNDN